MTDQELDTRWESAINAVRRTRDDYYAALDRGAEDHEVQELERRWDLAEKYLDSISEDKILR